METIRLVGILSQGKHGHHLLKEELISAHFVAAEILSLRDFTDENLFIRPLNDGAACIFLTSQNETACTI